ncbi:MAG: hypothetical protein HFJ59_04585 [Clostridia bacterium]|nr:hypothetical protein [Clostridia bacterium]
MKKKENKKLLLKYITYIIFIIISTIILILLIKNIYDKLQQKKKFEDSIISFKEKNQNIIFSINKIIFFSSSDCQDTKNTPSNFTISNLYAYTDIALFIDNNAEENTEENTLKSLKIVNVRFTKEPEIGRPSLFYKSINNFAKGELKEENKIEEKLEYKITAENQVQLIEPILYNNCANPITLTYINQNLKNEYIITDIQNPIIYNGKLLERCGIQMSSIETQISFDIEIENNKEEKFKTKIWFDIPYKNNDNSVLDGKLIKEENVKFNFYRYE